MNWSSEGGSWVKHEGLVPRVGRGPFLEVETSLRTRGSAFCEPVVLSSTGIAIASRTKVKKKKNVSITECERIDRLKMRRVGPWKIDLISAHLPHY